MEPSSLRFENLDVGTKVLLFEIYQAVQRLESRLQDQRDRLSLIETSIRSSSALSAVSPTPSGGSFDSQRPYQYDSQLSSLPPSPGAKHEGIGSDSRKFEFHDDDSVIEDTAEVLEYSRDWPSGIYREAEAGSAEQDHDAYSVSIYSHSPSRILLDGIAPPEAPPIPIRSKLRPDVLGIDVDVTHSYARYQPQREGSLLVIPYHSVVDPPHLAASRPAFPLTTTSAHKSKKRVHNYSMVNRTISLFDYCMGGIPIASVEVQKAVSGVVRSITCRMETAGKPVSSMPSVPKSKTSRLEKFHFSLQRRVDGLKSHIYRKRPYIIA